MRSTRYDSGTFRLGAFYVTEAKNTSVAGTSIVNFYDNPYYIYTLSLTICHPPSSGPCR